MEIDYQKLKELGIKNDGTKKQFCPECHKERKRHPKDKSLSVNWDNSCWLMKHEERRMESLFSD